MFKTYDVQQLFEIGISTLVSSRVAEIITLMASRTWEKWRLRQPFFKRILGEDFTMENMHSMAEFTMKSMVKSAISLSLSPWNMAEIAIGDMIDLSKTMPDLMKWFRRTSTEKNWVCSEFHRVHAIVGYGVGMESKIGYTKTTRLIGTQHEQYVVFLGSYILIYFWNGKAMCMKCPDLGLVDPKSSPCCTISHICSSISINIL